MAKITADRVLETSTTTGTGALTLAGAVTGYRAASAVCVNADTFDYYAEAVDANGLPTGDWETGLGTWGTGGILTRTTIYASSNAGAAVSWAAGTKRVGLGVIAQTLAALAGLGSNTFTGAQIYSDQALSRGMLKDMGYTVVDKGNSGTATQTYDYTTGSVQTSTATGNHTIAMSNWPPTGNRGELHVIGTNFGGFTITWPTITWILPDGTTTTSISTYLTAIGRTLQTTGVDQFLFWSRDAGTTVYGKLL